MVLPVSILLQNAGAEGSPFNVNADADAMIRHPKQMRTKYFIGFMIVYPLC